MFTKEFLYEEIVVKNKSLSQIANENDVSDTLIYNYSKKFNIQNPRSRKFRDLTGKIFNRLTVLSPVYKKDGVKTFVWKCRCECGNIINVRRTALISNITKSCGCLKKDAIENKSHMWRGFGKIPKSFMTKYKYHAKRRKIEFNLNIEYVDYLYEKQNGKCALSGIDLYFKQQDTNISIDRIDSSKGYIPENVWLVSKHINIMKHTQSVADFLTTCKQIIDFNNA